MANVYRRENSGNWQADLKDQHGKRWRVPLTKDRTASVQVARQLERLVALHVSSGGKTDPSMLDWLRRLTPAIYQRVQQRGLVDVEADGMRVTVERHLQEWSRFLRDANRTVLQAEQQRMRAATLLDGCLRLADVDAARIQRRLESLRQDRGWSQRTRNAYLKAAQQFERWLVKQGRATALGLTRLDVVRVTAERERRALTADEACRLLAYCEDAPTLAGHTWSLTGEQRRLLYLVAMKTGLRANELRCLRRADVDLEGGVLTVRAAVAKSRKTRKVPLPAEVTALLAPHCLRLHPGAALWRLPDKLARHLLYPDARACGIALKDDEGKHLDFHALRHTYGTWLDQHAGASAATAQHLLGHADMRTTQRYVHAGHGAARAAADRLPPLVRVLAATGTDDARECGTECDKRVGRNRTGRDHAVKRIPPATLRTRFPTHAAGFEPATLGSEDRCDPVAMVGAVAPSKPLESQALAAGGGGRGGRVPEAECGTECDKHDADLSRLRALWPTLPPHLRAALLTMAAAGAASVAGPGGR